MPRLFNKIFNRIINRIFKMFKQLLVRLPFIVFLCGSFFLFFFFFFFHVLTELFIDTQQCSQVIFYDRQ